MHFWKFLQYNNAVPIAFSILLLGAGGAFAATNPESIYSANQQVVSIDNTYLVNKDLAGYSPRVEITNVTEDSETYFVAYNFYTIDLGDSVWRDVVKSEVMNVSKEDLGAYRDLGVYVTEQLKQKTDRELAYLIEVKGIESRNVSQKVVATVYGGLIGKMLDTSTETLPGYTPVVTPPPSAQVASAAGSTGATQSSGGAGDSSLKIGLQLLGNNPARLAIGANYVDLGAVLVDPYSTNVGVHAFQGGTEVQSPSIDTSTTSVHVIEYRATDPNGSVVVVRRVVLIGDAQDPGNEISTAGNVTISTPTPTSIPTPAPAIQQPIDTPVVTTPATSSAEETVIENVTATSTPESSVATSTDSTPPTDSVAPDTSAASSTATSTTP